MKVDIIQGNNINLNKYYSSSDISIYKKYNIIKSSLFHAIIIDDNDDKIIINLLIYNTENYDKVISYLINEQYFNIQFDINYIDLHINIINNLLTYSYNMPYIYGDEDDKYPFPTLCLIYNPDLKQVKPAYIQYILEEYTKKTNLCEAWATFHKPTLHKIKNRIQTDKTEISGKLHIHQTIDEINKIVLK